VNKKDQNDKRGTIPLGPLVPEPLIWEQKDPFNVKNSEQKVLFSSE